MQIQYLRLLMFGTYLQNYGIRIQVFAEFSLKRTWRTRFKSLSKKEDDWICDLVTNHIIIV